VERWSAERTGCHSCAPRTAGALRADLRADRVGRVNKLHDSGVSKPYLSDAPYLVRGAPLPQLTTLAAVGDYSPSYEDLDARVTASHGGGALRVTSR
jgi:hypothetical protein